MPHDNIRDIRRLYSIRDVLARAGVDVRRKWLVCPLPLHVHVNYTPSFSIFRGSDGVERFKCHGNCQAHGDVIDLAGYLWVLGYSSTDPKDIARAIDALRSRSDFVFPTPERQTSRPTLDPRAWEKYLPIGNQAREFCHSRGLNNKTIDRFRLGEGDGYLTIPSFMEERLMGIKKRAISQSKLRYWTETGSIVNLFNYDAVAYKNGCLLVVKGEIACMLLSQWGYAVCAPTAGEAQWDKKWNHVLIFHDPIVIVGDNDDVGHRSAEDRAQNLQAQVTYPPEGYDIDSWMLAEPAAARKALDQWLGLQHMTYLMV